MQWGCVYSVVTLPTPFKQRVDGSRPSTLTEDSATLLNYCRATLSKRTCVMYEHYLSLFAICVGNLPTDGILPVHADIYLAARQSLQDHQGKPLLSPATLSVEVRTLKAAFNLMLRWEWIDKNPFRFVHVRQTRHLPQYLTKDQFLDLVDAIKETWLKDVVVLAACTGMRRAEIMNLRWDDVDFQGGKIIVQSNADYRTKAGKMRFIPMHPVAREVLARRQFLSRAKTVFPEHSAPWVSKKFKSYVKKLGLGTVHFHTLRHTYATWLVDRGVAIYEVQKLMGHSNTSVTEIYAHLMDEKLRASVNKLDFRRGPQLLGRK